MYPVLFCLWKTGVREGELVKMNKNKKKIKNILTGTTN